MNHISITFGKDKSAIIKGFAIVFMILLHVFGGTAWYEADLPMNHNAGLLRFMGTFQICVGIFVFMIGYGYAFAAKKDFAYSFHHIKKLLAVFWTVLFLFALPAGYHALVRGGGGQLLLNMFGLDETLTWVSWFIYLFIFAMIVMPFAGRLIDRSPYKSSAFLIFSAYLVLVIIHRLVPGFNQSLFWHPVFVCFGWAPAMVLGYLFARKALFQKLRLPDHWSISFLAIGLIVLMLVSKMYCPGIKILNFDLIYAPVIIGCILVIFSQHRLKFASKILSELGDKSVWMWFIHALFFTAATRPAYHRFVMISDNLWIVALWTVILSYICSCIIKKIEEY